MKYARSIAICLFVIGGLLQIPVSASAATGDNLRTITADRSGTACASTNESGDHAGVGVGIAFDGSHLLLSCSTDNKVTVVDPATGARISNHTIIGASQLGALSWDNKDHLLWACDGAGVGTIDLSTDTFTPVFSTVGDHPSGCFDGVAYDSSDDTIWTSGDVSSSVEHYNQSGGGWTFDSTHSVSGLLGACGNSGIASGATTLFLGNNGCGQIWETQKTFGSSVMITSLAPGRVEDLECDNVTFGAKTGVWSIDAYDNVLHAIEVPAGSCPFGGGAAYNLTVSKTGSTGTGTVTSNPGGIDCGTTCTASYSDGTSVTLTATPADGSRFGGWSGGGCSGTDTCTVVVNAHTTVTATFVQQNTLTVTNPGSGSGTITFSFDGTSTSCVLTASTSCSKTFGPGTSVILSASATSDSTFFGWTGEGCSGTGPCPVTMDGNKTVNAIFNQNSTGNTAAGFVPPGGTIQTCQNTSSADSTCSAITLPNTGPGATITITEQAGSTSTICNGPCSNQTTTYSITCDPATPCYTDINKPPKVILRYKLPGTSTKADMYYSRDGTVTNLIPNCIKKGIANPLPCVSARNRLGFGTNDLQVQVNVTSGDPIIGKR